MNKYEIIYKILKENKIENDISLQDFIIKEINKKLEYYLYNGYKYPKKTDTDIKVEMAKIIDYLIYLVASKKIKYDCVYYVEPNYFITKMNIRLYEEYKISYNKIKQEYRKLKLNNILDE